MLDTTKRTIATLTAAACLGGAGWAIAGSSNGGSATSGTSIGDAQLATTGGSVSTAADMGSPVRGSHRGETVVTGETAERITAAVLAEIPGATVRRIEQDSAGYHAHASTSDGNRVRVELNDQLEVTSVAEGRGRMGHRDGPCPDRAQDGSGGSGGSDGADGSSGAEDAAPSAGDTGSETVEL